jgi:uncharacterized membrane protein
VPFKKQIPSRNGLNWIYEGWISYRKFPWQWTTISFALIGGNYLLSAFIPVLGFILGDLLQTIIGIGLYRVFRASKNETKFPWTLAFLDLKNRDLWFQMIWLKILLILSVIFIVTLTIGIDVALGVTAKDFSSLLQIISTKTYYLIPDPLLMVIIANLLFFAGWGLLIGAALTFAAPLVAFQTLSPAKALLESLKINFTNVAPFAVLFLVAIPIMIFAAIPFFLGYLVTIPVLSISLMAAFDEIVGYQPEPQTNTLNEPSAF